MIVCAPGNGDHAINNPIENDNASFSGELPLLISFLKRSFIFFQIAM